jgi:hypothetical protein
MMTLRLLKERERLAYITGNVELAKLLGQLIDNFNRREYDDE